MHNTQILLLLIIFKLIDQEKEKKGNSLEDRFLAISKDFQERSARLEKEFSKIQIGKINLK